MCKYKRCYLWKALFLEEKLIQNWICSIVCTEYVISLSPIYHQFPAPRPTFACTGHELVEALLCTRSLWRPQGWKQRTLLLTSFVLLTLGAPKSNRMRFFQTRQRLGCAHLTPRHFFWSIQRRSRSTASGTWQRNVAAAGVFPLKSRGKPRVKPWLKKRNVKQRGFW